YGLALMRSGDLPGARQAFVAAGQTDLVKQVDEQLAQSGAPSPAGAAGQSGRVADRPRGAMPASLQPRVLEVELPLDVAPLVKKSEGALDASAPVPLAAFIDRRELRPPAGEPFAIAGELLVVRVDGKVPMRTVGALASSGRLAYAPVVRRVRGKASEEPF